MKMWTNELSYLYTGLMIHFEMHTFLQILSVEEEKLMEMKYVRRSPRVSKTNIEANTEDIKSDGVFKFHFSRIHVVVMFKLIYDVQVIIIN